MHERRSTRVAPQEDCCVSNEASLPLFVLWAVPPAAHPPPCAPARQDFSLVTSFSEATRGAMSMAWSGQLLAVGDNGGHVRVHDSKQAGRRGPGRGDSWPAKSAMSGNLLTK